MLTEDGTGAPAFPIYFAARLTRWLPGKAECSGATEPALPCPAGKVPGAHSRELDRLQPRDLPCQLYLDSLLPAVPATAGWQLPQARAAHGPAGPVAAAALRTAPSPW